MSKYRNRRSACYRRKERPELQWVEDGVNIIAGGCFTHGCGLVTNSCKIVWGLCQMVGGLITLSGIAVNGFIEWQDARRATALLANTSVKPVFVTATVVQPKTLPVKIQRLQSTPTCITLVAHKRLG